MGFWQGIRGAGRGAGASTAKLCEECDVGGSEQANQEKSFSQHEIHLHIYFIVSATG
jgi:hypothetical protein